MTIANSKTKDSPITSQTSSPSKKSPNKTLDLCSPIDNERSSSSCSSLSSNSPLAVATEDAAGPPPPLSVMRKKAQKQRLKNKQKTFEEVSVKDVKKAEELPRKNAKSCSGSSSPWQNSGSSSDEGSWRRRDGSSANRFFKQPSNGFTVNCNDFPALKWYILYFWCCIVVYGKRLGEILRKKIALNVLFHRKSWLLVAFFNFYTKSTHWLYKLKKCFHTFKTFYHFIHHFPFLIFQHEKL